MIPKNEFELIFINALLEKWRKVFFFLARGEKNSTSFFYEIDTDSEIFHINMNRIMHSRNSPIRLKYENQD